MCDKISLDCYLNVTMIKKDSTFIKIGGDV